MAPKKKQQPKKGEKPAAMESEDENNPPVPPKRKAKTQKITSGKRVKMTAKGKLKGKGGVSKASGSKGKEPASTSAAEKRKAPPAKATSQRQSKRKRVEPASQDEEVEELSISAEEEMYDWDRYEFIDNERAEFFNNVVSREAFLAEKRVDFDSLSKEGMDLSPYFDMKMVHFLSKVYPFYPRLVRLFYANLSIECTKLGDVEEIVAITSFVKGVDIKVTVSSISGVLKLDAVGYDKFVSKDREDPPDVDLRQFGRDYLAQTETERKLIGTRLRAVPRLLHMIIASNIIPRMGSKDTVTKDEKVILWHLMNKRQFNIPAIIFKNIVKTANKMALEGYEKGENKVHLPYPRMISKILADAGVCLDKEKQKKLTEKEIINLQYLGHCNIVKSEFQGWILEKYVRPPDTIIWKAKETERTVKPPAVQPRKTGVPAAAAACADDMSEIKKNIASILEMQPKFLATIEEQGRELVKLREEVAALRKKLSEKGEVPDTPENLFVPPKAYTPASGFTNVGADLPLDAAENLKKGLKWAQGFWYDAINLPSIDTFSWERAQVPSQPENEVQQEQVQDLQSQMGEKIAADQSQS